MVGCCRGSFGPTILKLLQSYSSSHDDSVPPLYLTWLLLHVSKRDDTCITGYRRDEVTNSVDTKEHDSSRSESIEVVHTYSSID
jgi:hypothetical protein